MSLTEIGKNVIINKKRRAGRFVEFIEAALQSYIYISIYLHLYNLPQFAQFCAGRMVGVCGILFYVRRSQLLHSKQRHFRNAALGSLTRTHSLNAHTHSLTRAYTHTQ